MVLQAIILLFLRDNETDISSESPVGLLHRRLLGPKQITVMQQVGFDEEYGHPSRMLPTQDIWRQTSREALEDDDCHLMMRIQIRTAFIASKGPNGLNMDSLTCQVKSGTSSIYRHFESKDQVSDAVVDLLWNRDIVYAGTAKVLLSFGGRVQS